ncbi:hypothetical protein [Paractinoplanes brasiliensis]|uniref:Actin-binding WH2 domain-containing protein n=1 Tax=Paractinoplanes brasiliensis TaxID=52695 RepID=A0A4R6JWP2_9ACTN|nr:hypothetical protein [Actinoplanes brasiliensis]TDO39105.1 hypothetical protein C8E87_2780 [Actinoplanes brasiliensis]GID30194.1 hypothetical protein Abr02nite_51770 [Actinoplanes brasiliensis]
MANASGLLVIERILRDRQGIWQQIVEDRELPKLTGQMLISSVAALAVYGAVLGSFHSVLMALTSAGKLPLLFLATLTICLPTLYLFNLVFGARLSIRQSLSLVMVALTVTAMLALAFAPISLFFLITAPDYAFFKLLNVLILALSALVGLRFLTGGMRVLNEHGLLAPKAEAPAVPAAAAAEPAKALVTAGAPAEGQPTAANGAAPVQIPPAYGHGPLRPAPRPVGQPTPPSMTLLYIWILLFGFVGTQLAWTLRPFFGSPNMKFSLYRDIDGNFYAEIFRTIADLL